MKVLRIGEHEIPAGSRMKIELPVAKLYTNADVSLPVHIIRGKKDGPTVFISAAIHGDELNGIEIIRRLLNVKNLKIKKGTLIAVPIVNVYGVVNQSRYMPDRRDLNRCFPGSAKGSLAGRVAHIFMNEIVKHCDYGIDLHTGAVHRSNLPQIRADLADAATKELAQAFAAPVVLHSNLLDGSLREAAAKAGAKVLVYEAGEALRFDEFSIRLGLKGLLNTLQYLDMVKVPINKKKPFSPFIATHSSWLRANASGIVTVQVYLGDHVKKGDVLAEIRDPHGELIDQVLALRSGIIIGQQNIPLVQEGEAMFHIGFFTENDEEIAEKIEQVQEELLPVSTVA